MKQIFKVLAAVSVIVLLASCASRGAVEGTADAGAYPEDAYGTSGVGTTDAYGTGRAGQMRGRVTGGPTAGIEERVVYFDFDSAEIHADSRDIVEANARYLLDNPSDTVVLEGHADERGTREYNIALGERRAESVRRLMVAYGVDPQQIRIVSYGEERPAVAGHDESSYSQNRRVEIVYL